MPDEEDDDDFEEVDPDELEEVDEHMFVESLRPGDPDYLVVTGRADSDVDEMLDDAFAGVMRPSVPAPPTIPTPARAPPSVSPETEDEDRPTDRPPAPVEDPDEAEFNDFMKSVAKLKPPGPDPPKSS